MRFSSKLSPLAFIGVPIAHYMNDAVYFIMQYDQPKFSSIVQRNSVISSACTHAGAKTRRAMLHGAAAACRSWLTCNLTWTTSARSSFNSSSPLPIKVTSGPRDDVDNAIKYLFIFLFKPPSVAHIFLCSSSFQPKFWSTHALVRPWSGETLAAVTA